MTTITREYAGERASDTPLAGYAGLIALFGIGLGALLLRADRRQRSGRVRAGDAVVMGAATHALTRVITKDWVTAPLRAPFVRYESSRSGGEVSESSRGHGMRRAIGDLLTCPYCTGPWVALGLVATYLESPRVARTVAWIFTIAAASNWLHRGYQVVSAMASSADQGAEPRDAGEVMTEHVEIHPDDVPEVLA